MVEKITPEEIARLTSADVRAQSERLMRRSLREHSYADRLIRIAILMQEKGYATLGDVSEAELDEVKAASESETAEMLTAIAADFLDVLEAASETVD